MLSFLAMTFPDFRMPSPLLDPWEAYDLTPTRDNLYHNRVIIRNHRSVFHGYPLDWETDLAFEDVSDKEE